MKPHTIFIAGPTASGKSDVALCLAAIISGEIISVDSMQVYRGLDIGTAKPSITERTRIPHHLIDVADASEPFDVAQFVRLVRVAETGIHDRGRTAIFCGGTGLYFKALLAGIGEAPPASTELRAELEAQPTDVLLAELQMKDPEHFAHIDQKNRRRVIRAIEVLRLTGRPYSAQRANWRQNATHVVVGLRRASDDLRRRIDVRVDDMFRRGLVEETRQLLDRGLDRNPTAMQAMGYRQVVEHLRGERPLDETIELVKTRTRQFAKRQMTWFRNQLPMEWIDIPAAESPETTARRIADRLTLSPPAKRPHSTPYG